MSDHDTVTCEQCDEPIVGRRVRAPICKRCLHAGPRDLDETIPECHSTVSERGHLRGAWRGSFER